MYLMFQNINCHKNSQFQKIRGGVIPIVVSPLTVYLHDFSLCIQKKNNHRYTLYQTKRVLL